MALAGALCANVHTVTGFTNRSLRARVAGLLGADYRPTQMSYDLGRLRRKELIDRLPHTNTYVLTPAGTRFALFYTKLHDRVVVPLFAADHPPTEPKIRNALAVIDHTIEDLVTAAHITRTASTSANPSHPGAQGSLGTRTGESRLASTNLTRG